MENKSASSTSRSKRTAMDLALEWLSRTIAILLFMVGPGLLGSWLDKQLGTKFLTPAGLMIGMVLATGLLMLLARKLTPPAGGLPIPFDDDSDADPDDAEENRS